MQHKQSVLMAGCGNMGGALLDRWVQQPEFEFTVVDPSSPQCPDGVSVVTSPGSLQGRRFDFIVIAVKPQLIADVIPDYVDLIAEEGCFLSIAAGFSAASLERIFGARALVRIMPNMPVRIGRGVSALFANEATNAQQREQVSTLMQATGKLIWVDDEDGIDRLTAVAGSGPGYVFEIARCWTDAGRSLGFSEQEAREIVLQTLAGSVELALGSEASLDQLRDSITSKKGTTEAGLAALNRDARLDDLLQQTVDAAYDRAVELR